MHYIFDRRLNMLDIAINDLSDEDLDKEDAANKLLEANKIKIPTLQRDKMKEEVKKEQLDADSAPKDFSIHEVRDYDYALFTVPFSDSEFIDDIFKTETKKDGLYIQPKEVHYKEYAYQKLKDHPEEMEIIRRKANTAINGVQAKLDVFASEAQKFNETILPEEINKRLAAEKQRRINFPEKAKKD